MVQLHQNKKKSYKILSVELKL